MGSGLQRQDYPLQGVTVRPATAADALAMCPLVRDEDMAEVQALGRTVFEALMEGLSYGAYVVERHRVPVAIFGVAPVSPGFGAVWMLGTHELKDIRWLFLRESRRWLSVLGDGYELLGNVVDARNHLHIRWLQWLGFSFVQLIPAFGKERRPFYEFCRVTGDGGGQDTGDPGVLETSG